MGTEPAHASRPPQWQRVLTERFDGSRVGDQRWQTYVGTPSGDPFGYFSPSHVSVGGGVLTIDTFSDPALGGTWASGGIATLPNLSRRYGRYRVRLRFEAGRGVAHVVLLVAANGSWPPEIDFSEDNGRGGQADYATLHYGADDRQVGRRIGVNLSRWHTFGLNWTPGHLEYVLDGRVWARVASSAVPDIPMKLAIQTQAWGCGINAWEACVDATTPEHVRLFVDRVTIDRLRKE
jgi:beta-glucanase (GH16 family)